jgi:hypothetical protein
LAFWPLMAFYSKKPSTGTIHRRRRYASRNVGRVATVSHLALIGLRPLSGRRTNRESGPTSGYRAIPGPFDDCAGLRASSGSGQHSILGDNYGRGCPVRSTTRSVFGNYAGGKLPANSHLQPRPKYRAYRSVHALTPPASFINALTRVPDALHRVTYRNARVHLLIVLLSALWPEVQRMMAVNGSAFLSKGRSANSNACRRSLLVLRRTL